MAEEDKKLEDVYFFWIEKAMKAQRKATNKLFKDLEIELTADQWIILKRLSEVDGESQRELAASVYKDPASLTRSLDILEKEGLIERQHADRRTFQVVLTKSGSDLVARVLPEAAKYREMGIKGISDGEMKTFKKVLEAIYKNFST